MLSRFLILMCITLSTASNAQLRNVQIGTTGIQGNLVINYQWAGNNQSQQMATAVGNLPAAQLNQTQWNNIVTGVANREVNYVNGLVSTANTAISNHNQVARSTTVDNAISDVYNEVNASRPSMRTLGGYKSKIYTQEICPGNTYNYQNGVYVCWYPVQTTYFVDKDVTNVTNLVSTVDSILPQ